MPGAGAALLLHVGAQVGWTSWSIHPSTVAGLAALGALYVWAERRLPTADRPTIAQRVRFLLGLVVIFLSLNGPIHDLSDYYLFSGHMVQHLLLTLVAPPLLVSGTTGAMLRPALGVRGVGAAARFLTRTAICYAVFNVTLAAWHLPVLYNTALEIHAVHIVEHLMFIATAVLMWWPLLSPLPELPRAAYPAQMLYCFLMALPMTIVAIYIAMADSLLYPAYASAPRLWGISPMEDQQYGGLIMWVPGGLFFYGVMSVVFFKWSRRGVDDTAGAQVDWTPSAPPAPPLPYETRR
jgi:putative membrane protein